MAFYSPDGSMDQRLAALLHSPQESQGAVPVQDVAITWVRYPRSLLPDGPTVGGVPGSAGLDAAAADASTAGRGASRGERLLDPGTLIRLPYLIAVERWLQRDMLEEEPDLIRALEQMGRHGCPEAISHVVDLLSGTTSGPELPPWRLDGWCQQRRQVDAWLASLGWPELTGAQASQKLWQRPPYGRERVFLGTAGEHGNRFSSDGLARLLAALLTGALVSPPASQRLRRLLALAPAERAEAPARVGLLAALLPDPEAMDGLSLWGAVGHTDRTLELALYAERQDVETTLLVLLINGSSPEQGLPLARRIVAELLLAESSSP